MRTILRQTGLKGSGVLMLPRARRVPKADAANSTRHSDPNVSRRHKTRTRKSMATNVCRQHDTAVPLPGFAAVPGCMHEFTVACLPPRFKRNISFLIQLHAELCFARSDEQLCNTRRRTHPIADLNDYINLDA